MRARRHRRNTSSPLGAAHSGRRCDINEEQGSDHMTYIIPINVEEKCSKLGLFFLVSSGSVRRDLLITVCVTKQRIK